MKRSKWAGATRVYAYGADVAEPLPAEAERQLWLAVDAWGGLVEIESRARRAVRAVIDSSPEVARLKARMDAVRAERDDLRARVRRSRQAARKAVPVDPSDRARIRELSAEIKPLAAAIKEAKQSARGQAESAALDEIEGARRAEAKRLYGWYSDRGLYWGTLGAVVRGYDTARVQAMRDKAELSPHRYTGEGRWAVQVQTQTGEAPLRIVDAFGRGSRRSAQLSLDPVDWSGWESLPRGERRRRARTHGRIRIGSSGPGNREPVWLEFSCVLHRPIPEEAQIVGAELVRRRAAGGWRYSLCITCREPLPQEASPLLPVTALDLRWRAVEGGVGPIRAGYALSSDGWVREILSPSVTQEARTWDDRGHIRRDGDGRAVRRAPEARAVYHIRDSVRHTWDLNGLRDRHFNAARDAILAWLRAAPEVPDWLAQEARTIAHWRGKGRMRRLYRGWRQHRFAGDQEPWEALAQWMERDVHLGDWEHGARARWQARRREAYRRAAAEIARRSSAVVIEARGSDPRDGGDAQADGAETGAMDLRPFARSAPVEDRDPAERMRHRVQRAAAPHELRAAVVNACKARGVRIIGVPAQDTSRRHHVCGEIAQGDIAAPTLYCARCGVEYDPAENACRNLLDAAMAASGPERD